MIDSSYPFPRKQPEPVKTKEHIKPYIDRGPELPASYGKQFLYAIVRDPECIFIFWELDVSQGLNWVIKISNLTNNTTSFQPVLIYAKNWYISNLQPDCEYIIELGTLQNNEFTSILKSNNAHTPRLSPADEIDKKWLPTEKENVLLENMTEKLSQHPQVYPLPYNK